MSHKNPTTPTISPIQGLHEQAEALRREIARFEGLRDACESPQGKQAYQAEADKIRPRLAETIAKIERLTAREEQLRQAE